MVMYYRLGGGWSTAGLEERAAAAVQQTELLPLTRYMQ
jgi:hypothetical protein